MASMVFKKNEAGIRRLLQSTECLQVMQKYAKSVQGDEVIPFVGFDRAKCFVMQKGQKK